VKCKLIFVSVIVIIWLTCLSLQAMDHPRCVGWGEIGLDYKVSQAPRAMQQSVLERQLRHAVRRGKPITIHTREAEEDTERILKAEVPKTHPVCFVPDLWSRR
jgi:TatD DNase family protein